ncbi:hypothetical protein HAX54_028675 [Datura stramonium]|uniref:Uncharacterized protein n=1 Tax=Datura stramonium TaxID=4076 RepID=A0ABS8V6V8_DATST|nr:hypothetical protein [Datura stramonium]
MSVVTREGGDTSFLIWAWMRMKMHCEVSVGGEKTNIVGGNVHVGENIGDVNVNDQVSQPEFSFVSMPVNDEVVVDGGVPRKNVAHPTTYVVVEVDDTLGRVARVGNESASGVFMEVAVVNESVVDPSFKRCYHREARWPKNIEGLGIDRPGKAQQIPFVGYGLRKFGSAFLSFVNEEMITKMGVAVYFDDDDYLELSYDFEVSSVSKKTWNQDNLIVKATDIMEYMYGYRLFCNTPWSESTICKAIRNAIKPYSVLLPIFLATIEFYSKRDDIVMVDGLHQW